MSKQKNVFEAADVRRAVEAEEKLRFALAEVASLKEAAAAKAAPPPPVVAAPPAPAPPPEPTAAEIYRSMRGPGQRFAQAQFLSEHPEVLHEIRAELDANRPTRANPFAAPPAAAEPGVAQ